MNSLVPEEMEKELKRFSKAISKFARDAKDGSDSKLQRSYSAVHDSFEKLARLSENINRGVTPLIGLTCPQLPVMEGEQVTLHAHFTDPTRDINGR